MILLFKESKALLAFFGSFEGKNNLDSSMEVG